MKRRGFLTLAAGALLVRPASAKEPSGQRPRIALVLGGGGCRGHGHVGVLRTLDESGLKPDLIVGSSVGSLVGALCASGIDAGKIERIGAGLNPNTLRDWIFPKLGFFGGDRIARFVRTHIGRRDIVTLPTRFAAIATDLKTGELVTLDQGEVGLAVQASSSAPGLLEPVRIGTRLLVDGNLVAPVPVDAARRLGATRVIAVDVSFPPEQADLEDPYDALYQGFSILTRRLAFEERARADLLIAPDLPEHNDMSRATLKSLVEAGARAARGKLPELRRLFAA